MQRVTGALLAFGSPWSRLRHLEPAASSSSSSIPSGPSVPREVARLALMTGRAGGVLRQRRTDARALLFRARRWNHRTLAMPATRAQSLAVI